MVRHAWLGAFGVAVLLGACGKSEGSGPVTRQELPTRLADVMCNSLAGCCKSSGHPFDITACKQAFAAELDGEIDEELSPNVRYNAEAAGDCVDALKATTRCGDFDEADTSACRRVFQGTLPIGAQCVDSDECREASGQFVSCYSEDGVSPAVCTLEESSSGTTSVHGKQGQTCAATCDEGDECDFASVPLPAPWPNEPAPLPVAQVVCYRDDGLYCSYAETTCQPLLEVGATCASN